MKRKVEGVEMTAPISSTAAFLDAPGLLLSEGSMYDRLQRQAGRYFDAELAHLALIYSAGGRAALRTAYSDYIAAALNVGRKIVIFTPTWRANRDRTARSALGPRQFNREAVEFVKRLRDSYPPAQQEAIIIGGLIGCRYDCYDPEQALDAGVAEEFHRPQLDELAAAGVDFLFASTLPAVGEAIGIARAMAGTGAPFVLSFVADGNGATLDGMPLGAAIAAVDTSVERKPFGYFVNCVHPRVLLSGLRSGAQLSQLKGRIIGLQGNTSMRDPREFDALPLLETESPEQFAEATLELATLLGARILGGCCGTGPDHIAAIGRKIAGNGSEL